MRRTIPVAFICTFSFGPRRAVIICQYRGNIPQKTADTNFFVSAKKDIQINPVAYWFSTAGSSCTRCRLKASVHTDTTVSSCFTS